MGHAASRAHGRRARQSDGQQNGREHELRRAHRASLRSEIRRRGVPARASGIQLASAGDARYARRSLDAIPHRPNRSEINRLGKLTASETIVTASLTTFFGLLGALLVLAFVANRLSKWTRVPDVIVLLATGIILGPGLRWVDASKFGEVTHGFGTLALILILFAAGLELDLRHALKQFG